MPIQAITRHALLKKISDVVKNLPDDQLRQVWDQVDAWDPIALAYDQVDHKGEPNSTAAPEIIEIAVTQHQITRKQFVRLPVRSQSPDYRAVLEICEATADGQDFTERLQANVAWWNQNCSRIRNDPSLHERYIAISDGALFSADSYLGAYNKARERRMNAVPYVFFLKSPNHSSRHEN